MLWCLFFYTLEDKIFRAEYLPDNGDVFLDRSIELAPPKNESRNNNSSNACISTVYKIAI